MALKTVSPRRLKKYRKRVKDVLLRNSSLPFQIRESAQAIKMFLKATNREVKPVMFYDSGIAELFQENQKVYIGLNQMFGYDSSMFKSIEDQRKLDVTILKEVIKEKYSWKNPCEQFGCCNYYDKKHFDEGNCVICEHFCTGE